MINCSGLYNKIFFRLSASRQVQMSNDSTLLDVVPFSLSFQYPSSIIQSMSFWLGLPLPLFPSSFLNENLLINVFVHSPTHSLIHSLLLEENRQLLLRL